MCSNSCRHNRLLKWTSLHFVHSTHTGTDLQSNKQLLIQYVHTSIHKILKVDVKRCRGFPLLLKLKSLQSHFRQKEKFGCTFDEWSFFWEKRISKSKQRLNSAHKLSYTGGVESVELVLDPPPKIAYNSI